MPYNVGLPVFLIRYIVEVAARVCHWPDIFSSVICKLFVLFCERVPGFDIRVVISSVALSGCKAITLTRFIKIELTGYRVLGQVCYCIEVVRKEPYRGTSLCRYRVGAYSVVSVRFKVDVLRLRTPTHRYIRCIVECELFYLATCNRHNIEIVVTLVV